jgi:hypothetical protein
MDLEFTKYLIGLFKQYYPYFLNYILIFEMPWILNGKCFPITTLSCYLYIVTALLHGNTM